MEDQPQDNKAKAGNEQTEQYQQLGNDGGEPKLEGTAFFSQCQETSEMRVEIYN